MKKNRAFFDTIDDLMVMLKILMFLVFLAYLFSGVSLIKPGEVAVILRLGALAGENPSEQVHRAGWMFALPYPIDEVIRIPEKQVRDIQILELTGKSGKEQEQAKTIDATVEGYCISGDQNIFQVRASAKYQIADPVKAIFSFSDDFVTQKKLLNDLTVQELSQISAGFSIDGILTESKEKIAAMVKENVQKRLDRINAGLSLISIELAEIAPPPALKNIFEEVNTAFIQRKKFVSEAVGRREELLPRARASSERILNEAHSYNEEVVAKAESEAGAFLEMLEAYNANPGQIKSDLLNKTRSKVFSEIYNLVLLPEQALCPTSITTILENARGSSLPPVDMQLYNEDQEP